MWLMLPAILCTFGLSERPTCRETEKRIFASMPSQAILGPKHVKNFHARCAPAILEGFTLRVRGITMNPQPLGYLIHS